MTVIAAYEDKDKYWIASDSYGIAGGTMFDYGNKLIHKGNYIIGFAWSYRVGDIISENKHKKLCYNINSIKDVRKFRDSLKKILLEEGGQDIAKADELPSHPVSLIIISPAGIFSIESDYQIHHITYGYYAIGSGEDFAFGALSFAKIGKINGKAAVQCAVNAAITHSTTCGGVCHIGSIPKV